MNDKGWAAAVLVFVVGCSGAEQSSNEVGNAGQGGASHGGQSGANASGTGNSAGTSGAGLGGQNGGGSAAKAGASNGGGAGSVSAGGGAGSSSHGGSGGAAGMSGAPAIPEDVGSGACHAYTPCGGDVVGSWKIDACLDPQLTGLKTFCPSATETVSIGGSADIRVDGTFSTTLEVKTETTLPASCSTQLGSCGQPGQGVNLLKDCQPGAAGTCICTSASSSTPSDATYTTTPQGLMTVVRDGKPSYSYYCRQGDEFWARGVDPGNGRISVLHFTKR